jgi:hypothetical protein
MKEMLVGAVGIEPNNPTHGKPHESTQLIAHKPVASQVNVREWGTSRQWNWRSKIISFWENLWLEDSRTGIDDHGALGMKLEIPVV